MSPGGADLLLAAALKATLWLALAGALSLLMWRRSAAQRHLVWVAGLAGTLALPFLQVALPGWSVPLGGRWVRVLEVLEEPRPALARVEEDDRGRLPEDRPGFLAATGPAGPGPDSGRPSPAVDRWDLRRGLVLAWSLGALLALAPLAHALLRIARIVRRATPIDSPRWRALAARGAAAHGLERPLELRRAQEPVTPLTWGVMHPVLILPEGCDAWSDERAFEVLVHEAGHVRRHDCLTQLLASVACVVYWFHPLVWLSARRMLTERERACDDFVLLAGARASDYANDLLDVARSLGAHWSTSQVTTAMARRSQISGRLLAVLDPHLDRAAVGRRAVLAGVVGSLLALAPLASVTLESASAGTLVAPGPAIPAARASAEPARPLDLPAARRELRQRQDAYTAALARRDLEALADFYTADTQVAAPLYPIAYGRRGVRGLLQHLVDAGLTAVELEGRELYPVGDLLCETGAARFTSASGATLAANRFITLWKNEDGRWRIHREWSSRY